jgi:hypothetical protein
MSSENDSRLIKLLNRMGSDLESTGFAKVARAIDSMPASYFQAADLAGFLYQNPTVADRLARYPAFLSLDESGEFKQLGQDADFQSGWENHAPVGALLKDANARAILENADLRNQIFGMVQTNLNDLTNYLETGKSPQFDSEKILGRWNFDVSVTVAMLGQTQPNIPASDMRAARVWMTQAYSNTTFVAASDGQAFLKNLPQIVSGQMPTTQTATWKGSWTADETNYDLTLSSNGENKSMTATTGGERLTLKDDKNTLIFDRDN